MDFDGSEIDKTSVTKAPPRNEAPEKTFEELSIMQFSKMIGEIDMLVKERFVGRDDLTLDYKDNDGEISLSHYGKGYTATLHSGEGTTKKEFSVSVEERDEFPYTFTLRGRHTDLETQESAQAILEEDPTTAKDFETRYEFSSNGTYKKTLRAPVEMAGKHPQKYTVRSTRFLGELGRSSWQINSSHATGEIAGGEFEFIGGALAQIKQRIQAAGIDSSQTT